MSKNKEETFGWKLSKFMHEENMGAHDTWKCVGAILNLGDRLLGGTATRSESLDDVWNGWQKVTRKTFWYKKIVRDASKDFAMKVVCESLTAARALWKFDLKKEMHHRDPRNERYLLVCIWLASLIEGMKCRPQERIDELALRWHAYGMAIGGALI